MTHEEILQGLYDNTLVGNAPEVKDLVNQGLADELRNELGDALLRQADRGAGDRERGDRRTVGPEHRSRDGGKALLELVDRDCIALPANRSVVSGCAGAECAQHLAVRGRVERDAPADPVRAADEMPGVLLREMLDAERGRYAEVDRLARQLRQLSQGRTSEVDQALAGVAVREAEEHRARRDTAVARSLHQSAALECADEAGGRALRQPGPLRQLADAHRTCRLDDADEQLGGAVDRLGSALCGHGLPYGGTSVPRLSS